MMRSGSKPVIDQPPGDPWPVTAKKLLTERERSLYQSLVTLHPDHKIFVQVALSQLIDVPESHPDRQSIRNKFSQLVADFILCRADFSVVCVIELDDRSHERADRQYADARKNKALADARIRLLRIPAGPLPSTEVLRNLIEASERSGRIYPVEPSLTLAKDIYAPAIFNESAESKVAREFKRVALQAAAVGIFVLGGWLFATHMLPTMMQRGFAPLAKNERIAVVPSQSLAHSRPKPADPVVLRQIAKDSEAERAQAQAIAALESQKNRAWAAFYSAPASCEHPVDWSAQVECGNQYMRAKKAFEKQWIAQHEANQGTVSGLLPGDESVGAAHK